MDYNEYHMPNTPNTSYIEKRSASMAIASLVLAIAGLVMGCCIYPAIIFGSLAIILALLSRGGPWHYRHHFWHSVLYLRTYHSVCTIWRLGRLSELYRRDYGGNGISLLL